MPMTRPTMATRCLNKRSAVRRNARLPPELIDIVIDYSHEDKATLMNFAQVSRRWLRSTRYHLFYHVRVPTTEDMYLPFVQFLENSPHMGQFIRELHLCRNDKLDEAGGVGFLEASQLIPIIRRLPFLHTVILSQVYVIAPETGTWNEFTMPLQKLVLSEIYSDCDGAQWLVTVFRVYDTFHILDPIPLPSKTLPPVMNMPTDSFNLLENLKSLVVESRNDAMSLRKVEGLMPFIMKNLTNLELLLELDQKDEVVRLEDFIRSKGINVRHLRLDINDVEIFKKEAGINLTSICPRLQSLQLCLFSCTYFDDVAEDHWGYAIALLANGPRTIRRVTIGMITQDGPFKPSVNINWSAFEKALIGLRDLEYVKFQAEGMRDGWRTTAECAQPLDDEWRDYLTLRLPSLRTRGFLRFLEE